MKRRNTAAIKAFKKEITRAGLSDGLLEYLKGEPEGSARLLREILATREKLQKKKPRPKLAFKTKLGKLYSGDCLSLLDQVPDKSIDLIFADPPFNLSKKYGRGQTDNREEAEYLEWTRAWIDKCIPKLKDGGAFYVFNIPKWSAYIANYLSTRLTFRHWIAVDLTLSMPVNRRLYPSHYALLYFIKGAPPRRFSPHRLPIEACVRCGKELHDYGGYKGKMNPSGVNLRDIWVDIPPVRHNSKKNRRANELNVKLLDRVLDISSKEGDLIFDPFGGSGTTYVVAELKKRRWLGIELGHCRPIIERFRNIANDRKALLRHRNEVNKLFSDSTLLKRIKNGLPIHHYRIPNSQISRVLEFFRTPAIKLRDLEN